MERRRAPFERAGEREGPGQEVTGNGSAMGSESRSFQPLLYEIPFIPSGNAASDTFSLLLGGTQPSAWPGC